jgi:hypothetical protein
LIIESFKPIKEQDHARGLFLRREDLRIDAYAGTGKTTTLSFLQGAQQSEDFTLPSIEASHKERGLAFPIRSSAQRLTVLRFAVLADRLDIPSGS